MNKGIEEEAYVQFEEDTLACVPRWLLPIFYAVFDVSFRRRDKEKQTTVIRFRPIFVTLILVMAIAICAWFE